MAAMQRRFGSLAIRVAILVPALLGLGFGVALMAQSGLGLAPWQVFHQGIARQVGLPLGTVTIIVGCFVLLAWLPLGQRPGIGTVLNVALVGTAANAGLGIFPSPDDLPLRVAELLAGFGMIGICSGIYLALALGPGPRDGLMTGIHRKTGWSIARTRTGIEVIVLVVGIAMGGTFGIGTILYAFGIGVIIQAMLRVLDREGRVLLRPVPAIAAATSAEPPHADPTRATDPSTTLVADAAAIGSEPT
jgi:uncharacterized membrane protein YczE